MGFGSAGVVLAEVEEFVTGVVGTPPENRVLSTILFTDIVSSTAHATELGDHRWRDMLNSHDKAVRRQLDAFGVRRSTQPAMAFSRPSTVRHAPSNAHARSETSPDNSESKCVVACTPANLSSEETTSRVSPCTSPLEWRLLPNRRPCGCRGTVTDLVTGSGIRFSDRGNHDLKGVPGTWALYAVADQ